MIHYLDRLFFGHFFVSSEVSYSIIFGVSFWEDCKRTDEFGKNELNLKDYFSSTFIYSSDSLSFKYFYALFFNYEICEFAMKSGSPDDMIIYPMVIPSTWFAHKKSVIFEIMLC